MFLEEVGTPEEVAKFKANNFQFDETARAQNISKSTASSRKHVDYIRKFEEGFSTKGREAWFAEPPKGTKPTLLNKKLGLGRDLMFQRGHFFSTAMGQWLNDLGLLSDKAKANFSRIIYLQTCHYKSVR